jgi:hypothetical protein
MLSIKPNLTVDEIRTILSTTAQDLVGNPIEDTLGWDQYYGAGRVNAYNALTYVQNLSNTDFDLNNLVKIHPNPVKNTLYISSSTVLTDSFSVSIYDVTGRFIKGAKEVVSTIDVSDLNNGVYFVTISKNNELISRKFIKE